jgi:hypothetical protein
MNPKDIVVGDWYLWQPSEYQNSGESLPKRRVQVVGNPYREPGGGAVNRGSNPGSDIPVWDGGPDDDFVRCEDESGQRIAHRIRVGDLEPETGK